MGEFEKIVGEFSDTVNESENNSIGAKEIGRIVGEKTEHRFGKVNCYPGIPGAECHNIAFFISLTSKRYIKKRGGNLSFSAAVSQIVKHMQGSCIRKTHQAVFITDNWDTNSYDEWKANLKEIGKQANLEIYLLTSGSYTEISI